MDETPLITVVDDDDMVVAATRDLIETLGFRVCSFQSGIDFLRSGTPSAAACLLVDVQMPGMTGFQLHRELAGRGELVPTIFMTAFPDERGRAQASKCGAVCYLGKPLDRDVLLKCIRSVLESEQDRPST